MMKFIPKFFLFIVFITILTTQFLWLFSAEENNSLPNHRRSPKIVKSNRTSTVQTNTVETSTEQPVVVIEDSILPEIMNFLPNLLRRTDRMNVGGEKPFLKVSQHRRNISLVIAIPSVQRNKINYLNITLSALLRAMNDNEKRKVLIVVLLSDLNASTVTLRHNELDAEFSQEIKSGLIEVVAPSLSFYPNFNNIVITLGDPLDRVKWRMKQALDFAYIMMYSMNRGEYFLQLEDDVIATYQFPTKILQFIKDLDASNPNWMYIEFSVLGYIGKLFHNRDLLGFSVFYMLFCATKPVDWLLPEYVATKLCAHVGNGAVSSECQDALNKAIVRHSPSLFQHLGYYSSLEGKIQDLQDDDFSLYGNRTKTVYQNPPAILKTSLKHVDSNTLESLYLRSGYLWVYSPWQGDFIEIGLTPPIALSAFEVVSGLLRAPTDIIESATLEIKPVNATASLKPNGTLPGFFVLASFDAQGHARGQISAEFGQIEVVRVNIFNNHTHWIAIRTFYLMPLMP